MTVFRFNIWYKDSDNMQVRYVLANTEEEAFEKLEKERIHGIDNGMADFTYTGGWVELEGVIV